MRMGNKAPTPSAVLTSNPPPGPKLQSHTWRSCRRGARRTDRAVRGSRLRLRPWAHRPPRRAEAAGRELVASSPSLLRVSLLRAWGLEAARPGFPRFPLFPGELTSSRAAPSPRLGPAPASRGCPAGAASQPGLPLAPFPP